MHNTGFGPSIVITFTLLFSQLAFSAATVESQFELKMPKGFQQRIIDKEWNSLEKEIFAANFAIPDQTFNATDIDVVLAGLRLDFQTKLQKPVASSPAPSAPSGPSLVLHSKDMGAHLTVQSISVDQIITREIGGVIGRFRVQAKCENILLTLKPGKGRFQITLSPILKGSRVSSKLDDLQLAWSEDAWEIGPMTCTGAQGFESLITEHIANLTKNSGALTERKEELIACVQSYLDTKSVDLSTPQMSSQGRPDIQFSMRVTELSNVGQDLVARGTMLVVFKNIKSAGRTTLRLKGPSSSSASSASAELRVPEQLLEVLMERAFVPGTWQDRVDSTKIPGFTDFMMSKLIKCLLWPEMEHFSVNDRFQFDLSSRAPLNLEGSGFNYSVNGVLDAKMKAPKAMNGKTRYVPYMRFQIPLQGQVRLGLANGLLSATFTNVDVGIQHEWESSYIQAYRPNQNFYGETLRPRLVRSLQGHRIAYQLPKIELPGSVSLQVRGVRLAHRSGDFIFNLN